MGPSYDEKHYHRALEIRFKNNNVSFIHEYKIELPYENESIGKFFADFLICSKIILEIKKSKFITNDDRRQLYRYLKATKMKLGIIANFGRKNKLQYVRIINL